MPRQTMTFALSLLLIAGSPDSDAAECPVVPPVPTRTSGDTESHNSWRDVDEPSLAGYAGGSDEEPSFSVGYLEISNADKYYYDWLRNIVLPLWTGSDEEAFDGWIRGGRVYPVHNATPYALTGAGLVETDYESSSFIVHEALDDGWLRIRLKGEDGEVWTHRCHLQIGAAKLAYNGWESFLREHGDWLHFRSRVPHMLREEPDASSPRITTIGLDHKLVLREIHGDWMRVTVEQTACACANHTTNATTLWAKHLRIGIVPKSMKSAANPLSRVS